MPLRDSVLKETSQDIHDHSAQQQRRSSHIPLIISLLLNVALLVVPLARHFHLPQSQAVSLYCELLSVTFTQLSVSECDWIPWPAPAQSAVETKIIKFTRGVEDDIPIYEQRPSPAVDDAWRELYAFSETSVSRSEAAQMGNKTWPILGAPDHYLVALDVFHQLHCLDMVRQRLHPGHNYTRLPMGHLRHCIGAIRQALMCAADITPVVWQWSDELKIADQRDDILHVCRDYGKIQTWAKEHHAGAFPDVTVYIEDAS
ncbi:hypothetical protein C8R46DRAFT_912510 [Mycena filopes]|nr:hypothetical protein C8R46DRAFT_912510 [Mycena filopes]